MRKIFIYCVSAFLLSYACAAIYAASKMTTIIPKSAQNKPLLFIQGADYGSINKQKGLYTLTLTGVDTKVHYFADRPFRDTGWITNEDFLSLWDLGAHPFNKVSPNVVMFGTLEGLDEKNNTHMGIFVLSNPNYDKTQNKMTYTVKPTTADEGFNFSGAKYKNVHIVVDSFPGSW